ncbi:hypothetical protein [Blastococcus brunescens]|uniref:Uncharacterized protein n=1 Tax=Blastococcus brunescens TaxID=1564165 RepID=A0ABZ1ATQ4_9ACTN|nr:hypothetical protein [Blastococcus sp. BMG 8361]WRL61965.1 hypothetical protein U6N30_17955 [Blastococcus sp. BMG 8361]
MVVNFIGITESVVMNMLMTFVEVAGLLIVMVIGIWYIAQGTPTSACSPTSASPAIRRWRCSPASPSRSSR